MLKIGKELPPKVNLIDLRELAGSLKSEVPNLESGNQHDLGLDLEHSGTKPPFPVVFLIPIAMHWDSGLPWFTPFWNTPIHVVEMRKSLFSFSCNNQNASISHLDVKYPESTADPTTVMSPGLTSISGHILSSKAFDGPTLVG